MIGSVSGGTTSPRVGSTALPEPAAARLHRPSWRDARLLVGVLIVLASVVVGARVVAALDRTTPVYAATTTLAAGRTLAAQDLRVVRVHLGDGAAAYLPAGTPLPAGAVLLRSVGAGELVPASAVGPATALTRRPVAIPVAAPVPTDLRAGAFVDVWSSARVSGGGTAAYRPAERIARVAEVYAVAVEGAGIGAVRGAAVQVLLEEAQVRVVLDALANGSKLAVVPVPGSAPAAGGQAGTAASGSGS